ncbi:MAG: hypothetical protein ACI8PZ_004142 [Myxococcota bacterium]|jgi:hypothetical protein
MLHRPARITLRVPLQSRWLRKDEQSRFFESYRSVSGLSSPDGGMADGTLRAFFEDGRMIAGTGCPPSRSGTRHCSTTCRSGRSRSTRRPR